MNTPHWTARVAPGHTGVGGLREEEILRAILPPSVVALADVGPGDDAAVLPGTAGRSVVTTDSMVLDLDWRDDWSSPQDVGCKLVAQNIADIIAMGARPTGVVLALATEASTTLEWLVALTEGMSRELQRAGTGTLGGDLSGLPSGVVLTMTALGELAPGEEPFLRSQACAGEVVVVSERLGRSQAGLLVLSGAVSPQDSALTEECVAFHRAPRPRYAAGEEARARGLRCAMDVSDGLVRDAGRIARASGVQLDLDPGALDLMARPLEPVVGERALECVLSSGEEHCLLGTCPPDAVPVGWHVLGAVREGDARVTLAGAPLRAQGWDHFGG